MGADINSTIDSYTVLFYENNHFKEERLATSLPETMRVRRSIRKGPDGQDIIEDLQVKRIEVLFIGKDGKLTTPDQATEIIIYEYAEDGTPLFHTKMIRQNNNK